MKGEETFQQKTERIGAGLLAIATGLVLAFLALAGPLLLGRIHYRTATVINNQIKGQDLVNLAVLCPLLFAGGVGLLRRRSFAPFLVILAPLYLIYYALSYTIGWEWSSPACTGNNERYTFWFIFVLVASLLMMLYALSVFPRDCVARFPKKGLAAYSSFLGLFLLLFAAMWIKDVRQVIATGTATGYDIAPTAFWLVRVFDLGFSIPLGLVSIWLLWSRPATSFPVQFMFYGFFLTMIAAVDAMGIIMWLKRDPTFRVQDLVVFLALAVILAAGFIYILRHYQTKKV